MRSLRSVHENRVGGPQNFWHLLQNEFCNTIRAEADIVQSSGTFAFDPKRKAILLVAGDKSGGSEKRFYRGLMRKADERFDAHLARIGKGT